MRNNEMIDAAGAHGCAPVTFFLQRQSGRRARSGQPAWGGRPYTLLIVLLLLALQPVYAQDRHVILVSIDGLAAYHLENETLVLPNIRELIKAGVWAQSSETVFPSVTHPSHTTLITGVPPRIHGVLNNRMRNRETGESFHITNKPRRDSIKTETLFDAAKKKGLTTAAFFWPETKQDPSIDFNIPEAFDSQDAPDHAAVDARFLQELEAAGVPIDLYFRWYPQPFLKGGADAVLAAAAGYAIREYRPHLLLIHLLATDTLQHRYGPDHYLAQAALTAADHCVGILRQAVEEAGIADTTTMIVTADHGFHTVRYELNLYPFFKGLSDRVKLHPDSWALHIELKENFDAWRDGERLENIFEQIQPLEGVSRIIRPEDLHDLGLPRYEEDPHMPGQYMVLADIDTHMRADPIDRFVGRLLKQQPSHSHGYLPAHPRMYPALVLAGAGIKSGERIGHVTHYDIAPTISFLLRLEMPKLPGRVLREALAP